MHILSAAHSGRARAYISLRLGSPGAEPGRGLCRLRCLGPAALRNRQLSAPLPGLSHGLGQRHERAGKLSDDSRPRPLRGADLGHPPAAACVRPARSPGSLLGGSAPGRQSGRIVRTCGAGALPVARAAQPLGAGVEHGAEPAAFGAVLFPQRLGGRALSSPVRPVLWACAIRLLRHLARDAVPAGADALVRKAEGGPLAAFLGSDLCGARPAAGGLFGGQLRFDQGVFPRPLLGAEAGADARG